MESLEGKRGIPRIKPPFPAVVGLYGGPTVINNAETIASVPHIFDMGGAAYAKIGTERNGGTRLFGISGHVNRARRLRAAHGLQPQEDDLRGCAAASPAARRSRPSFPAAILPQFCCADEIDIGMDFDQMGKAGSMLGSGGVVVLDETV